MTFRRILLILLSLLIAMPAAAQDVDPIVAATQTLDKAAAEFKAIDTAFDAQTTGSARAALQDRAAAVKTATTAQVTILTAQLALIDARVVQLGPVTPGIAEAPDIRAQRKLLTQQRSTVDSAIKRGKLLGVEADQLAGEIAASQADAFSERMSQRIGSPLTAAFWTPALASLPRDMRRTALFVGAEFDATRRGATAGGVVSALLGVLAALVLVWPARRALRRLGQHYVIERVPGNRVRRSGLAIWLVAIGTLVPWLAATVLLAGLRTAGMIAPAWADLATAFQKAAFIAAFVSALGSALLQRKQPSWRLISILDETAHALRPWTLAVAALAFAGMLLTAFVASVGASGPAREFADLVVTILHIALVLGILIAGARLRASATRDLEEDAQADFAGAAFVSLAAWAMLATSIVASAMGYLSLGYFVSRFIVWIAVVAAALYLGLVATDDICSSLFARDGRVASAFHNGFGVRRSLIDQFGVALSAALRLVLIALALGLIFMPFGSNIGSLFDQASRFSQGVTVGQITIAPGAILRACAVLAIGLFVVRGVQRWLTNRYLPATDLDAGARNSIAMVARYAGLILAVLWAMASLGIGIERIALLLSALSVGIGFGLQAITQNFVSGLILLAERPVKIGDWVKIGDQEGDVKRISVRATEIMIADRSTLIVPNSELITKSIVNKTMADPLGRIQLQFSVPLGTDIGQVRDMLDAMFEEAPAVLDDPAVKIFIDSIADGRVNLNMFAYVRSPRDVYPTRSDILFKLLRQMPEAGIELGTTPQQVQWIGAAPTGAQGVTDDGEKA
jgi:small-conductance mechanosensitive channel